MEAVRACIARGIPFGSERWKTETADRLGLGRELEWKKIGFGQAKHESTTRLRERNTVFKIGVAESAIVIERIVDGVVRAAAIFAAVAQVERGDAKVLKKRGIIRARAEGADAQVTARERLTSRRGGAAHEPQ